jgi:protocatechuate 3,4-dioxygenase beta subunit
MRRVAAALVGVALAIAWFAWSRDEPAQHAVVTPKPPKRVATGKRPDPHALAPATLSGTVRDPQAKPLAGAYVCLTQERDHRCVRSAADGHYALAAVIADAGTLGASLARYQPQLVQVPAMQPAEQRIVDIVLVPGGAEVTGVVEDILGGPIARAHVHAEGAHAETDDEGRFMLWVSGRTDVISVSAEADGYSPHRATTNVLGKVTIALSPESSISGRVVDATTGAAIAGARILTHDEATTSGPDGAFSLGSLAPGDYGLAASAPGRYGELARTIAVGIGERVEGVELRVSPARTVIATLDVQGDHAICAPKPALKDWTFQVPAPWRDDAGRFHFDAVPPSTYSVEVGCGASIAPLVVGNDDVEVTWHVETGGRVQGAIRLEGAPRLVTVTLARVGSKRAPLETASLDNHFELRGVPAGRYALSATLDRVTELPPQTIDVENGKTLEHDIVVDHRERFHLRGTATDNRRRPITSGTVTLRSSIRGMPFETTIVNGAFEVEVPNDVYTIEARSGELRSRTSIRVTEDTQVAVMLLAAVAEEPRFPFDASEQRFTLRGRVVDAQHVPVGGAVVMAAGGYQSYVEDQHATTDAAGTFRLTSRFAQMNVSVYRIGGGSGEGVVRTDQPAEIVLAARALITGTVVRPDGAPATRFLVRVGEAGDAHTQAFDHTGGAFAIEDKHVYPLRLVAVINNLEGEPVTITPQSVKANVVLRVPKTVDLRGRIIDAATRAPIANVRVYGRHSHAADGWWGTWFTHDDQVTGADGRFTIREVPPGPMMLEAAPALDTWSKQTFNVIVPDAGGTIDELGLARTTR